MDDYYKILGVNRSASQEEIKKEYRILAKQLHPDRHQRSRRWKQYYAEMFMKVNEAYSILSNPVLRADYDIRFKKSSKNSESRDIRSPFENAARTTERTKTFRRTYKPGKLGTTLRMAFDNILYELVDLKFAGNSHYVYLSEKIRFLKKRFRPAFKKLFGLIYEESE